MYTTLSAKFAALAFALMINGALMGSVAYLFGTQANHSAVTMAIATVARHATVGSV